MTRWWATRETVTAMFVGLFMLQGIPVLAQWKVDGIPAVTSTSIKKFSAACSDDSGGVIVAWVDSIRGTSLTGVHAQRVDVTGRRRWGSPGVTVLSSAAQASAVVAAVTDMAGGAFIVYTSRVGSSAVRMFAQHLDGTGAPARPAYEFPPGGSSGATYPFIGPVACSDGRHGVVVTWVKHNFVDIVATRLNPAGAVVYADSMVTTTPNDRSFANLLAATDGAGGAYIAYKDPSVGDYSVFLQSLDSLGVRRWGASPWLFGVPSPSINYNARITSMVPDGAGGVWLSGITYIYPQPDFAVAAHIRADGTGNHGNSDGTNDNFCAQTTTQSSVSMAVNAPDSAWVVWSDARNGNQDLFAKRLTGAFTCGTGDSAVCIAPGDQHVSAAVSDDSSGVIVLWADDGHIHAQRLDPLGRRLWGPQGLVVCGAAGAQSQPVPMSDGGHGTTVAWSDGRTGGVSPTEPYVRRVPGVGLPTRRITVQTGPHGSASTGGVVLVPAQADTTILFTPDSGYYISDVFIDQGGSVIRPNVDFTSVDIDHDVRALFANSLVAWPTSLPARTHKSLSWPLAFSDSTPSSVLASLGSPDPSTWRLWRWAPELGRYAEAGRDLGAIRLGEGYWLIAAQATTPAPSGRPWTGDVLAIELANGPAGSPGWNQVSNPYRFPVAVADLRVTDGTNTYTVAESTLTSPYLLAYSAASRGYAAVSALQPGEAYWIKKKASAPVQLVVPNHFSPVTAPAAPDPAELAEWSIGVSLVTDAAVPDQVLVGAATSTNGYRVEKPPPMPGAGGMLVIEAGGGVPPASLGLGASVEPRQDRMEWRLRVSAPRDQAAATLAFACRGLRPVSTIELGDSSGTPPEVITDGERVVVPLRDGVAILRLVVGIGRSVPAITHSPPFSLFAWPSPTHGHVLVRSTREGARAASVYDVTGRLVRSLEPQRMLGGTAFRWDGRDAAGRPARGGVYWIRSEAGSEVAQTRVVLLR